MKKNDVVVIGSGISGLLTALALSREGKKVLILEKEDCIGGFPGRKESADFGERGLYRRGLQVL
ncbi:FAD-dependent oxidoreductase [Methanothrix sp.]|uniref:FAD-dependent oxidoreductase n=1 Tax=Methanothrix sp. TaxID=90426 RepID=UPI002353F647|nr:FAD-dependent oxidoreductase [Methanothrix sp.]